MLKNQLRHNRSNTNYAWVGNNIELKLNIYFNKQQQNRSHHAKNDGGANTLRVS